MRLTPECVLYSPKTEDIGVLTSNSRGMWVATFVEGLVVPFVCECSKFPLQVRCRLLTARQCLGMLTSFKT